MSITQIIVETVPDLKLKIGLDSILIANFFILLVNLNVLDFSKLNTFFIRFNLKLT